MTPWEKQNCITSRCCFTLPKPSRNSKVSGQYAIKKSSWFSFVMADLKLQTCLSIMKLPSLGVWVILWPSKQLSVTHFNLLLTMITVKLISFIVLSTHPLLVLKATCTTKTKWIIRLDKAVAAICHIILQCIQLSPHNLVSTLGLGLMCFKVWKFCIVFGSIPRIHFQNITKILSQMCMPVSWMLLDGLRRNGKFHLIRVHLSFCLLVTC